jgi:hypothetical protein
MLTKMFAKIRGRRLLYSGTRVMKLPDDVWQKAIEMSIREADAVVIDISDISDTVAWEINTVHRLIPPKCVLLTWYDGRSEIERVRELQTRHANAIFGQQQENRIPRQIRESLYQVVPELWVSQCRLLPYDRERKKYTRTLFGSEASQLLVRCFVYSRVHEEIMQVRSSIAS